MTIPARAMLIGFLLSQAQLNHGEMSSGEWLWWLAWTTILGVAFVLTGDVKGADDD